jgi:glutamine phosphoribosylpyrophosphate amidotransferase
MGDFIAVCASEMNTTTMYEVIVRGLQRPLGHGANAFAFTYLDEIQKIPMSIHTVDAPSDFENEVCRHFNIREVEPKERSRVFPKIAVAFGGRMTHTALPLITTSPCRTVCCFVDGEIVRREVHAILHSHAHETDALSDRELFTHLIGHFVSHQKMRPDDAMKRLLNLYDGDYIVVCMFSDHPETLWIGNRNRRFSFGKDEYNTRLMASSAPHFIEGALKENVETVYPNRILRITTGLTWKFDKLPFIH